VLAGDPGRPRRLPFGLGHGLRLEIDPTSPFDMYLGLYEFELAPYVREFCTPGARCFDIGAFDGYYALVFSRLTGSEVIVFESDADACRRVRRNCDANPDRGARVEIRHRYVAFETNPAENCIALDDCLRRGELFAPDVIKVDVDRAELSVLSGALELLATHRPRLIVETHSLELERACGDLLVELGYRPKVVTPRRWLAENRSLPHNRWLVARGAGT
jgi:Methyltransferase FkbM domain